ncbi:hypothetical protein [Clostridium vincentii]|uniref:Uncharacterized protein n=1 Tax=Clostridium vincentii TaxID=52704 RepID=A0A2T0BCY1_9CLOT|nr:hypothetical protein [Clostridium vincentii]PRR81760.1 hypothetical protein CLVI_22490 [Clostridium vincentii]
MKSQKSVVIFWDPSLYFFPKLSSIIFKAFNIPRNKLLRLIFHISFRFNLPIVQLFYGDWKNEIKDADIVVLFEWGYNKQIESYIRNVNKHCKVHLYYWNIVDDNNKVLLEKFSEHNHIWTTDKNDCKKYNLRYNSLFFTKRMNLPLKTIDWDIIFVGIEKNRGEYLVELKEKMLVNNMKCKFHIVKNQRRSNNDELDQHMSIQYVDYATYLDMVSRSKAILDIVRPGQIALTQRSMESIFFRKKMVTNSEDIKNYDFYNQNNIFVISNNINDINFESLYNFLNTPYVEIEQSIIDSYDYEGWIKRFLDN